MRSLACTTSSADAASSRRTLSGFSTKASLRARTASRNTPQWAWSGVAMITASRPGVLSRSWWRAINFGVCPGSFVFMDAASFSRAWLQTSHSPTS